MTGEIGGQHTPWTPLCNHFMLSRKPANDQNAKRVKVRKSDIIARKETKSMFSDITLNASLGIRIGAATLSVSSALRAERYASCSSVMVKAWRRRTRYVKKRAMKPTSRKDQRFCE